ncbi:MAG: IS3 family transposase [Sterolibacteriaceae bacterium]|nr:IS3 family transposase [Candidatus Methylophosphatis haderslevensis]
MRSAVGLTQRLARCAPARAIGTRARGGADRDPDSPRTAQASRPIRSSAHDHGTGRRAGRPVNHKRIGRIMRTHDLASRKRRRFRVVTTDSKHAHPVAPNVLGRDFAATAPNQKWLADLTYVPTDEGWLYLALVLDLFGRKIVGWAMSDTMPQELTAAALWVALGWRDPQPGLMHHSDRGSQYAARHYRKVLEARGITVSMSRKGDCWDNAPMESANGTLKVECVHGEHFRPAPRPSRRSSSTSATTIRCADTRRWETSHRLNSSGAGMPAQSHSAKEYRREQPRVIHRRPVSGSSQATEPAGRG